MPTAPATIPHATRLGVYVINLASAGDRWAAAEKIFAAPWLRLVRVPAVNGAELEPREADYSERLYHQRHGRTTNLREVGCYLSHLRACEAFLESAEEHALICEDDVTLGEGFEEVAAATLRQARHWDIVRLSGLGEGHGVRAVPLGGPYALCVNFGRLKGAGAYLVNRKAARSMVTALRPMKLPFDHAIDREWRYGLRALSVLPFPVSQTEAGFRTSIQKGVMRKLSRLRRWRSTYPYQVVNEVSRWVFRAVNLVGLRLG